ncbi:MAG: ABC transporter ATP-binding protein [Rhodomicrobium sp.]
MSPLVVSGLSKSFEGLTVLRNVSLWLDPGVRHLIIGPNGAGKTTLFNLITGEIRPDGGTIEFLGCDVTREPGRNRAKWGMARTYQIITLFERDTITHNVLLALLALSPLRWNPFLDLKRQPGLAERAGAAIARVGLEHLAECPLSETTYGERRRVEIAVALAQEPKVLLLDEPFAGLSADERKEIKRLLDTIPRSVTVLMIEHDMDVALDFAEHMTLLNFGEVVVQGTREEVLSDPRTREVYLGS